MNRKMILITTIVALVALVCGFFLGGFFVMKRISFSQSASLPGTQPGYGPGMMGGRGPMMGGRGPLGSSVAPDGYTPVNGLVPVTADGKPISASSDAPKLPESTATQKVGNLNVTLALSPYPPASFQNGNFDITLVDDKGQPVTDAKITFDLTMPGMWMPPSKPAAQSLGDGKYRASAFWTMRGLWRIQAIIQRGSEKQSAFFDVWL